MRLVLGVLFVAIGCVQMGRCQDYSERYRLQVHFSVPFGWLNDPNGVVYHDGQYHLFYQHHPHSTKWGPMHWGHAQSTDLIHWQNMPIALRPYGNGTIFSGCCVVDAHNHTGLAAPNAAADTLVALYTFDESGNQSQAMAFSSDNGLTWTHYDRNPVIANPGLKDFRDPNVFERNGVYYMALAAGDKIMFYSSADLLGWQHRSDFGLDPNQGDKSGVWECPSIVRLSDEAGNKHDVLTISENGVARGSLVEYFVGTFADTGFTSYYGESQVLWADHGPDNYAAVPYHNDPKNRTVTIGWMANWLYGQEVPTPNWRGQMTIPRELSLRTVDQRLYLAQRPVDEFRAIKDAARMWILPAAMRLSGEETVDISTQIPFRTNGLLSLEYSLNVNAANSGKIGFRFSNNLGEFVSFYYDIEDRSYEFDRRFSGKVAFNQRYAKDVVRGGRIAATNTLTGHIILDTAAIEIFADGGLNTFTALFFPTVPFDNVQVYAAVNGPETGKSITIDSLNVTALNGIWAQSSLQD